MAEPTSTSGDQPLTDAEQKQLDDLTAKRDRAAEAQAKKAKTEKLATLAPVVALLKLVKTDKVNEAVETVLNDPAIDFETKQRTQGFKDSLTFNIGSLSTTIEGLSA